MESKTIRIGELEVRRMGYGAMRLPGPEVWGEPTNSTEARAVLRRAVALGINLIDTAWYYGPYVADRLIVETLHPYPKGLVLVTKLGGKRLQDKSWAPAIRPEELKRDHENELRALKRDHIDLVHLRFIPSDVPWLESVDAMIQLQREGKLRYIGVSNVTVAQLDQARARTPIASVQNVFSVLHQGDRRQQMHGPPPTEAPDAVLQRCEAHGIPFMPFFPLAMGTLGKSNPAIDAVAAKHRATVPQIALAWLLHRSKVMLPIPGTSSVKHLEENWAAQEIELSPEELDAIARD